MLWLGCTLTVRCFLFCCVLILLHCAEEGYNELLEDGQDGEGELGQSDAEEGNMAVPSTAGSGKQGSLMFACLGEV